MSSTPVIGIDPSLVGTAVCTLDFDTDEILDLLTFTVPKDMRGIQRLNWLTKKLTSTLKKNKPKEIFIESYSYMSKGRSIFDLGELGGVFRLILARQWGGYYNVAPKSLKKFITGNGNAKKQILLEQTFRKYGKGSEILRNDNEVDAFGLAKFGIAFLKWKDGKNDFAKYEIEALKGVTVKCTL
jgi:crossover junction endodeoxyribonuclease RuvC